MHPGCLVRCLMLFVQVHLRSPITRLLLAIGAYLSHVSSTFSDATCLSLSTAKGDKMGKGKIPASRGDNSSDEGSTYLEDQVTRCSKLFLWLLEGVDFVFCSKSSPDVDECDAGNRDPELEDSYKGLANIKYVFFWIMTLWMLVNLFVARAACIISWSNKEGPGQPCYTGIQTEIPKIDNV